MKKQIVELKAKPNKINLVTEKKKKKPKKLYFLLSLWSSKHTDKTPVFHLTNSKSPIEKKKKKKKIASSVCTDIIFLFLFFFIELCSVAEN